MGIPRDTPVSAEGFCKKQAAEKITLAGQIRGARWHPAARGFTVRPPCHVHRPVPAAFRSSAGTPRSVVAVADGLTSRGVPPRRARLLAFVPAPSSRERTLFDGPCRTRLRRHQPDAPQRGEPLAPRPPEPAGAGGLAALGQARVAEPLRLGEGPGRLGDDPRPREAR